MKAVFFILLILLNEEPRQLDAANGNLSKKVFGRKRLIFLCCRSPFQVWISGSRASWRRACEETPWTRWRCPGTKTIKERFNCDKWYCKIRLNFGALFRALIFSPLPERHLYKASKLVTVSCRLKSFTVFVLGTFATTTTATCSMSPSGL